MPVIPMRHPLRWLIVAVVSVALSATAAYADKPPIDEGWAPVHIDPLCAFDATSCQPVVAAASNDAIAVMDGTPVTDTTTAKLVTIVRRA